MRVGYPVAFGAYENWPLYPKDYDPTQQYQVRNYGSTLNFDTWYTCVIDNALANGSQWYAAVNGTNLVHGLQLQDGSSPSHNALYGNIYTSAERWYQDTPPGGIDNRASFAGLQMKDSQLNWYPWSALTYAVSDDYYWGQAPNPRPSPPNETYWWTTKIR